MNSFHCIASRTLDLKSINFSFTMLEMKIKFSTISHNFFLIFFSSSMYLSHAPTIYLLKFLLYFSSTYLIFHGDKFSWRWTLRSDFPSFSSQSIHFSSLSYLIENRFSSLSLSITWRLCEFVEILLSSFNQTLSRCESFVCIYTLHFRDKSFYNRFSR